MSISDPSSLHFWHLITRLGEAQIVLPGVLLTALTLLRRGAARPLAAWWLALLGAAVLVTTVSKVAFIGWGLGWPEINFTGVSGHAMFAMAVYPVLFGALASRGNAGQPSVSLPGGASAARRRPWTWFHAPGAGHRFAIATGYTLALLIGVSRVVVGAHSVSEVLAGWLVGGTAGAVALYAAGLPRMVVGPVVPAALVLWLAFMPVHAPASSTHSAVTRLSLMLSGHKTPYTRSDMLRRLRQCQNLPCQQPACAPSATATFDALPTRCPRQA
jgi:membrane-associated phospholipid phosphatase